MLKPITKSKVMGAKTTGNVHTKQVWMLLHYLVVTSEDPRSVDRNCGFGEDLVPS